MSLKLYEYGIELLCDEISTCLESAAQSKNKVIQNLFLGKAVGMVNALKTLVISEENTYDESPIENDVD